MSIENNVAIIIRAGRGVGRATAQLFAQKGAHVVLFSRTQAHLDETNASISREGGSTLAITGDVAREEDVQKLFEATRETYGRVDILVNCAGMVAVRPFVDMD